MIVICVLKTARVFLRYAARMPLRRASVLAAVLLSSSLALGWTQTASFGNRIHGHEFHKVAVEAEDCVLKYRLDFLAPEDSYKGADASNPRFRFVARLKFKSGDKVMSPIFPNAAPGERKFQTTFDTTREGCWARNAQQLIAFDVKGCRGKGCTPDGFD